MLLARPFLRQGTFTPVPLRGPAPNGHPCPDGALAASMRLDPLRETCVQPAPKSRFAVFALFAYEIQSRSTASRLKPVLQSRSPPLFLIVPTLRVVMPPRTLRVPQKTYIKPAF